ncbi:MULTISPECIES: precorrin-3B synthase [Streptomyces]|uniref:Precorrin-3B synthase n=1 Tax=Streptomyces koelreuteriae TaxID=2838015 RepID=A0ABX8G4E4_9ACTN|nr:MULTISPECIES: precorrin-3B synthase [Streptomyces]QWB28062.1 precorrin-3B synthase [Streptomyces koelreuteriae]UUA11172.1 precorrin-3B synthase [Streptomyces koelreuteriae]UUA18776.1 precorrin-3B synthase [Streptomyces sp. CRCS-T-1]
MLAAMSTAAPRSSPQATAVPRDRGDACPGTLRLHAADDGALARVRIPGGVLTVAQAETLGDVAVRLGDGDLHLTSRGNAQLRGLPGGCAGELAESLDAAGLLPSHGHERVRNIVASPLSGLDGRGFLDVRPWLTALDAALCASEAARALSGRFLFALDDGRGDVAGLDADVTVRATADGGAELTLGAAGQALRVGAEEAARAALAAAETFLEAARTSGDRVWRVDELSLSGDELLDAVGRRLRAEGIRHERRDRETVRTAGPPPGVLGTALSVHVPLGRLSAHQWRELTRVAAGELRLTPWRGVVLPTHGTDPDVSLARLAATGLVTGPGDPWLRVGACIGSPGCAKSRADVRADAAEALDTIEPGGLPLYWSGCERRCGHPRGDRVDVVAAPGGGYLLSTAVSGQEPRTASMDVPARLATALAAITS